MREWLYIIFELPRQLFKIYITPILKKIKHLFKIGLESAAQKDKERKDKKESSRCKMCNMNENGFCELYGKEIHIAITSCKFHYESIEKISKENRLNIPPKRKRR